MLSDEEKREMERLVMTVNIGMYFNRRIIEALAPVIERIASDAARAAERALVERLSEVRFDYVPTIRAQLECANTATDDCSCTFCDYDRDLRAALRPEAATTERRWDECLHGVTLGSVCLDCPSKWASIPARPAATTEGAAGLKVCWRSECRNGCYYDPDACSVTAAAVHPETEGER